MSKDGLLKVLLLCLVIAISGCGGSNSLDVLPQTPTTAPSASVRLQSVLAQTAVPSQVESLRASGYDGELNLRFGPVIKDKAASVEWSEVPVDVTDFVIEYLDARGQIVGLSQSAVTLVAGQAFVIENPTLFTVSSPLQMLTLSSTSVSIASGTKTSLILTGHFTDGSTLNLTSAASWTSSSPAQASVEEGTVQAGSPGASTITATFAGKSAQAQLTVTDAALVSLSLSPNSPAIAVNTSQDFTVEGFFSDGSFQDLTAYVEWQSSDSVVATIAAGTAQGLKPGQSTISASYLGKSGSTVLTITPALLESIDLEGAGSIPKGASTDFTASGHFSDGTTQDLTSAVSWQVDPPQPCQRKWGQSNRS